MKEFSPVGISWEEARKELLTPEEITESDLRVTLIDGIMKIRQEQGISQRQLEKKSGMKQPVITGMKHGMTISSLSTVLKVLVALGKTFHIGDPDTENVVGETVPGEKPYKSKWQFIL